MKPIIKVENLSKQYRLGNVGTGTLSNDLKRWWHKVRGEEDPFLKIGESNDRTTKGGSEYVWALKDINFEVMPGEVLGIIGKNGAGKSTLLKILSKVTGPTTGRIDFNGRIGSLLEVGTGFHPELTGRENIYLNGAILGMTKAEINRKLDEIIDFSGCERYIDTPVKRYSSGMTVRLGFAVAAHLEPEILVVDEVLAVGDAEFQKKAIGKMQDVSKNEGRTVLFVSHNMAAVKNLCHKGLLIENGNICFEGEIQRTINNYLKSGEEFLYQRKKSKEIKDTGLIDIDFINENNEIILDFENFEYCWIRFVFESKMENSEHWVGFTIFNDNSEPIISSISSDSNLIFSCGLNTILCKIPCGLFLPGNFYLEFNYNGKNVEGAILISKSHTFSRFIDLGNKSKSNLILTEWHN